MSDPRERALSHVRRYPKWYAAAAAWLLAMMLLPVVELDPLQIFNPGTPGAPIAAPAADDTPTDDAGSPPVGTGAPAPIATPTTAAPGSPDPTTLETVPLEEVPAGPFDAFFDAIPPPAATNIPEELMPVVRAAAPIATYGCSGLGLATLVIAVVAPSAEGVPLERMLPYLAPVTSACANFPIPETYTVCEADKPFILDIGGLAKGPPILGLGIDQLQAFEDLLFASFGEAFPRLSDTAREVLDCELVK